MSEKTRQIRAGMTSKSLILGGVLWTAVFAALVVAWQGRQVDANADAAATDSGASSAVETSDPTEILTPNQSSVKVDFPARQLPAFEFEECMGGTLSLEDLKGKPWVASFIFTSCPTTCPMITASFMKLQNRVMKKNDDVMLVTFTVYPRYDTAEILKTYSETFQPKRDRWKFLTGDIDAIHKLIVEGFGLYVKENVGEEKRTGFEVAHSNRVVLVNEEGIPVGTFLGTRDEDMAKLAQILTGKDDFPEPGPSLNISTTDGSPLQIQFDVRPVETPGKSEDEQQAESDSSSGDGESPKSANPTGSDSATDKPESNDSQSTAQLSPADHNALIDAKLPPWAKRLPTINAGLNSLAAVFLVFGYAAIRKKNKPVHRNLMISAFLTSVAFLACYLTYHYLLGKYTGEHGKQFAGDGNWRTLYFSILIPHVLLAALVPLMAIRVFQHAFSERWDAHKKLAKVTFPIWMFVSVSGVVIYGMLYHWPTPATATSALR